MNTRMNQDLQGKPSQIDSHTYFVKGMHCASCEILIEKRMLEIEQVKFADASLHKGEVVIKYEKNKPSVAMLNTILKGKGYTFFNKPIEEKPKQSVKDMLMYGAITAAFIFAFLNLDRFGVGRFTNITAGSSLPTFFLLGVLAGVSSCAALVGGLILSVSKQWSEIYGKKESFAQKLLPHTMFNSGRIISFGVFGYLLGVFGSKLQLSLATTAFLVFVVSAVMIVLGLQMAGLKTFQRFQVRLPKFVIRNAVHEKNYKGKYMPFALGVVTFFLPCGFTVTAQGLALISGNPIQASLIMLLFALGTTIPLFVIGLSTTTFLNKPGISQSFPKIAAAIILFFAAYNINNQLAVIGLPNVSSIPVFFDTSYENTEAKYGDLAPIVDGKQVMRMNALAYAYEPNYFILRSDIPVRWEISNEGASGCTNAVISKDLFDGEISIVPGEISVKEFIPPKPGRYRFSCWMGMVSGVIEVIDSKEIQKNIVHFLAYEQQDV